MRLFAGLCVALLLAACGKPFAAPYSGARLVSATESAAAPVLRPGLWLKVDPDCPVDSAKPRGAWPPCATAIVVRPDEMLRFYSADSVEVDRIRLAVGLPMILQMQHPPVRQPTEWYYEGLRPTLQGDQIVEYSSWPAMCEPYEPPTDEAQETDVVSPPKAAVKGALPLDERGRCLLGTRDTLRSLVIASEGWTADREHLRWVPVGRAVVSPQSSIAE